MSGVYAIVHRDSGRRYVGGTRNILRRLMVHRRQLRRGVHPNGYLQAAWDADGPAAFDYLTIEEVAALEALQDRERHHLALARSAGSVFNIKPVAALSINLSAANLGKHAVSADRRAAHGAACRGYRHSDAAKQKISARFRGRSKAPAHRAKLLANLARARPGQRGMKRSAESRQRQADAARLSWASGKRRAAQEVTR